MIPLLIDANGICHKAKHTLGDLNNETAQVGVIFGFFLIMLRLAKENNTNKFVFAWDSKNSHRQRFFPAYKEQRRVQKEEKTEEEKEYDTLAYAQFDQLREKYLPAIGFKNNYMFYGYEGDDIIASIVENSDPDQELLIVSSDEDMYQCLWPNVSILKNGGKYTEKKFIKEYGITPDQWVEVKALAGCSSDGVPGIKGIGEKTAIKYILGQMGPHLKTYQNIRCPEGKSTRARNLKLVKLPYPGLPELQIKEDGKLSLDAFMDMCKDLNFQHFLKKEILTQWKEYLKLR